MSNPKRPRDPSQRAKLIVDIATGESDEAKGPDPKSDAKRKGGTVGGRARSDALTPERRSEIARKAARARWAKRAQV